MYWFCSVWTREVEEYSDRLLDNVVATPHIGFVSRDLYRVFYQDTVANIATWLQRNARL